MNQLYLVFSERHLDGELMNAYEMRREVMIAKYRREVFTVIEVDPELKQNMVELLDELDAAY